MDVTLMKSADKVDEKNRDMLATIQALRRAVNSAPELRFERRELLSAIFADITFLAENLGPGFEALPSGLGGAMRVRAVSEREVELWIDYRLLIRSVTELTNPKPGQG